MEAIMTWRRASINWTSKLNKLISSPSKNCHVQEDYITTHPCRRNPLRKIQATTKQPCARCLTKDTSKAMQRLMRNRKMPMMTYQQLLRTKCTKAPSENLRMSVF